VQVATRHPSALLTALAIVSVCVGSARADVVTFTRLGRVTVAVPGNALGVAVGDPVRLDLTLDRDFVFGPTPLSFDRLIPPVTDSFSFFPSIAGGGFEIRLAIGALLLRESDDEEFDRNRFQPSISGGGNSVGVWYAPVAVLNGTPVRGMVTTQGLSFVDTTDSSVEREIVAAVFDQAIDPPPVRVSPLSAGPVSLLRDDRRLEHLSCPDLDLNRTFSPPPVVRPLAPFADFSGSVGQCFSSQQDSTLAPARMQGSGSASGVPDGTGGFSRSASRHQVAFALDSLQPFSLSGRLTKTCESFIGVLNNFDVNPAAFITPFAVLRRADGSEVQRVAVADLTTPDQFPDPNDPESFDIDELTLGGDFTRSGQLPAGEYELEVVADSERRGCRQITTDRWSFDLKLGEEPMPMPPPDADRDGIPDAMDNCRFAANPDQRDAGGVAGGGPDGIGDACQCGDVTGDGRVDLRDAVTLLASRLPRVAAGLPAGTCDVDGDGRCAAADGVEILRALGRNGSSLGEQRCRNARASGG
jgi:hypothetical protein